MTHKRDYYEVLGVSNDTSNADLKKAYRNLAHKYHPDKNPGDKKSEDKFKEASEAYSILSDPEKKIQYDRFGHDSVRSDSKNYSSNISDVFGDIFGDIFGGRSSRAEPREGADIQYKLSVEFKEAAFGVKKEIIFKRHENCRMCKGSGAKSGTRPLPCRRCSGMGEIRASQGFFAVSQTCPSCNGNGQIISNPCNFCNGEKYIVQDRKLLVNLPPGVENGTHLRFRGEGEVGELQGPRGDLYVTITVKSHSLFNRRGATVLCDIPISFTQAALGAKIDVPTLDGKVSMNIPNGTQTGSVFRLKNIGIPKVRSHSINNRGDQLIKIYIEVPKRLNKKQRELLQQFAEITNDDYNHQSFFGKVKELF